MRLTRPLAGIAALLVFEALIYAGFYFREVAWFPPQHYDQAGYLTMAYELQELLSRLGLRGLLKTVADAPSASGPLFPLVGGLLSTLFGGGRLPALLVNFLGFVALQLIVFSYVRRSFGTSTAWVAVGLILSQATLWFWAGGLFDFRMDFLVYCLWGVWVCAVLRSEIFLERNWALIAAAIAILLVLIRFIALVYLFGVLAGLAAVLAATALFNRTARERSSQRLRNLGICAVAIGLAAAPVLFRYWADISAYYIVGHLTGEEKHIRAAGEGIVSWIGHIVYYPRSIVRDHLGGGFLLTVAVYYTTIVACLTSRNRRSFSDPEPERFTLRILFILGAILGPLLILTFNISKSPVVGSVVGIPVVLFVIVAGSKIANIRQEIGPRFFPAISAMVLAIGLLVHIDNSVREPPTHLSHYNKRQWGELLLRLNLIAQDRGWQTAVLSVDSVGTEIFKEASTVWGYEQTRVFTKFRGGLGHSIFAVSRDEAFKELERSDIVVLSDVPKVGVFPFFASYAAIEKEVQDWSEKHLIKVAEMPIASHTYRVYARPKIDLKGLSAGWITSAGLKILMEEAEVKRFATLIMEGAALFGVLPKIPAVAAKAVLPGGETLELTATLARHGSRYEIIVDLSKLPVGSPFQVQLGFDTFFVPKELGANADERRLVIMAPDRVVLR